MDEVKLWLKNLLHEAFNSFDSLVNNSVSVLSGGGEAFGWNADDVWDQIIELSDKLKPFCLVVIGICLLIELAQVASKVDIIKWEHGLKLGVKMVFSKLMIEEAPRFLKACYDQSAAWIAAIGAPEAVRIGSELGNRIDAEVDRITGNIFQPLILFVVCLIPLMAVKICGLLVEVIAFGRMFELYCLLCVSPLPCAFFPLGDGSGGGFSRITRKFFLNFIGVCLHGVMIIISIQLFKIMMVSAVDSMGATSQDAATNITNLCYAMLLGGIVLVMACAKSGQWAKSILDAG